VTVAARSAIRYHRARKSDPFCAQPTSEATESGVDSLETVNGIEAREVLEKARKHLTEAQFAALLLWLEGWDHGEIAERLHLEGAVSADRLVRSGLWRLRDRLGIRERVRGSDAPGKKIDADD
jgi:DNA-directed RNA polymerase specialized sigma24 family protein